MSKKKPSDAEYCNTVQEALDAGWLRPYEGGRRDEHWKGRIYGFRPGNHRVFRCKKGSHGK